MNTNNRNNNRRRGRGNRQNNGGGGQQLNRIDSRARGNAPQLLEKYRKLAHDAHLNGDRVQAEYYLQFADHYFRVIADQRSRQEEQRARRDERWEGGSESEREESEDSAEFNADNDFPSYDQPHPYARREREERGEWQRREREDRDEPATPMAEERPEGEPSVYEPAENPFVRGERSTRGLRPRRDSRPARDDRDAEDEAPAGLDPSTLPPPISAARDDDEEPEAKPRRGRPRKTRPADDAGEALESVN